MHSIGEIGECLRRQTVEIISAGGGASGSGVVWPGHEGLIITNAHVARELRATVRFWDGTESPAQRSRMDRRADLAALTLSVRPSGPARIRDSADVRRGELVIAVGNPLGFTGALSTGVVHAVGPVPGLGSRSYIQAQVRLATGNSGGPLADAQGRIIGINSMVVTGGLGLAVPANVVLAFLAKAADPVRLGVTLRPVRLRSGTVRRGLLVLEVEQGSRAESASLLPGDILSSANGRPCESTDDLGDALVASTVRLEFLRGGSPAIRQVVVPLAPARTEAA